MERAFHETFSGSSSSRNTLNSFENDNSRETKSKKALEERKTTSEFLLDCYAKKEYFKMLGLPEPDVDELGKPTWSGSGDDVGRAYRKLAVLVHPDKNREDVKAREAFDVLSEIHRMLKNPEALDEFLRGQASELVTRRARREAALDISDRVELYSRQNEKAKILRKEEAASFGREIKEQMRRRQEEAKLRAEVQERALKRQREMDDEDGESHRRHHHLSHHDHHNHHHHHHHHHEDDYDRPRHRSHEDNSLKEDQYDGEVKKRNKNVRPSEGRTTSTSYDKASNGSENAPVRHTTESATSMKGTSTRYNGGSQESRGESRRSQEDRGIGHDRMGGGVKKEGRGAEKKRETEEEDEEWTIKKIKTDPRKRRPVFM